MAFSAFGADIPLPTAGLPMTPVGPFFMPRGVSIRPPEGLFLELLLPKEGTMRYGSWFLAALLVGLMADGAGGQGALPPVHLNKIKLPPGFTIDVYARVVDARSMALGAKGTVFVGTRTHGKVYALVDTDRDYKADEVLTIAEGLYMPNGVAFRDGSLYVAEVNRILRFDRIEENLRNPPSPVVVRGDLPTDAPHGWKYLRFGPDGKLYFNIGAPCNICEPKPDLYATIMRMNPDGTGLEPYAMGVRNSVGFDWNPQTKTLWFTNNGRDGLGDNVPPDELNAAPRPGLHFGFPYCFGKSVSDPEFGKKRACTELTPPALELPPHAAPLGVRFYTGKMFPREYQGQMFIAEHGSWDRSTPSGYRVTVVRLKGDQVVGYEVFAEGWVEGNTYEGVWGRPVDLLVLPDGSMLVSDDQAHAIYRISYKK
jgi:glucose/arabinose dehydrogenase